MKLILLIILPCLLSANISAQMITKDIVNAFEKGDAKEIAAHFHDNLELQVLDKVHITSKNQASRILQDFFKENKPVSFTVNYEGIKQGAKYGLGILETKEGKYRINLYFMDGQKEKQIYQLTIEKG